MSRITAWLQASDTDPAAKNKRLASRLFWTGLIVRVLYLTIAHTYRFRITEDHFQFGWEMGRIGRALATGYGFADPFDGHTGPTAWNPPLYPLLIGGVFRIFGVYTRTSGWVLLTINSIFSAATAPLVAEIARRCFAHLPKGKNIGGGKPTAASIALWSGWLWALYPAAMQYAVRWIWDMSLTTFFLTAVFVIALRTRGIGEPAPPTRTTGLWAAFGILWGLIALSNSSLLLILPITGLWMLGGAQWKPRLARNLAGAAIAAILCAAVIAPWAARNYRVFHAFIPFRDNFNAELDESLNPEHMGFPWGNTLTLNTLNVARPEFQHYVAVGESQYLRERSEHAHRVLDQSHDFFLRMSARRVYFFWIGVPHAVEKNLAQGWFVELTRMMNYAFLSFTGLLGLALAIRNRIPAAGMFTCAILLMPIPYYFVTVQARFRHPIEPLIAIFTVYLFQSADRTRLFSTSPASDSLGQMEHLSKSNPIQNLSTKFS